MVKWGQSPIHHFADVDTATRAPDSSTTAAVDAGIVDFNVTIRPDIDEVVSEVTDAAA